MIFFLVILASCLALILLIVVLLIRYNLVVITVESESMTPTLQPGDRVLVLRRWHAAWLRKGSIVLVWPSYTGSRSPTLFEVTPYIKRIVGLGGEILTVTLNEGPETNRPHQSGASDPQRQQTWHIPEGHIFVRGDRRQDSLDSLAWGPIHVKSVLGVMLMKLPRKSLSPSSSQPLPFDELPTIGLPVGQGAPPFAARALSGEKVTLATYRGRAVVFLFFAPSYHCRNALMTCADLASRATAAGVTIVCVSSAGLPPTRLFVEDLHPGLPVLVAPRARNPFLRDYNISGTPAYCFIDEQGRVQSAGFSGLSGGDWKALVDSWGSQRIAAQDGLC